jgi:RES domain-containing protein
VVARMEHNFLINDSHPEFERLTTTLHKPVWWDDRLFPSPKPLAKKPAKTLK